MSSAKPELLTSWLLYLLSKPQVRNKPALLSWLNTSLPHVSSSHSNLTRCLCVLVVS